MNDKLNEAIETLGRLKHYIQTDVNRYGGGWDSIVEAIDTVVEWAEKPLPTDEQIREMSNEYARKHTEPEAGYVLNRRFGFQTGAKWMRGLIRDKRSQVEKEIVPTQKICQKCGSELINTEQYGWFCPDIACRIEGQNQHLNNTTYTAEEIQDFAEWCSKNAELVADNEWVVYYGEGNTYKATTTKLRELWERERMAK